MKEITTLRNYIKFRQEKGGNMASFIDALDAIEAYIHALEQHHAKAKYNPYREALAKLCCHYFADLYWDRSYVMMQPLRAYAEQAPDIYENCFKLENIAILDILVEKSIEEREQFYRVLADDLVNIQEVWRYKRGEQVEEQYQLPLFI